MRLLVVVALLVGCEKAPHDPPRPEPPPPAPLKLRYAAKTQNSAAGPNQTFFHINEDEQLFAVADAGGPGPGDPSRLAAEGVSPFPREACRTLGKRPAGEDTGAQLACVMRDVHARLAKERGVASLGVLVVEERTAHVAIAGDVQVMWIHGATHAHEVRHARDGKVLGGDEAAAFTIHTLAIEEGDTFALVNRELVDTLRAEEIARLLDGPYASPAAMEAGVGTLIGAAEKIPDHPALTAIVVHAVKQ